MEMQKNRWTMEVQVSSFDGSMLDPTNHQVVTSTALVGTWAWTWEKGCY
jgi:hypothetical protein